MAKQTLRKFIRFYNRGASEKLHRLFTEEPEFLWYSAGPPGARSGGAADRRSNLLRYFKVRHRRHDRLHLRYFGPVFKDHGIPFFESATHFSLHLSRRADGFNRGRWFRMGGKGALVCEDGRAKIFIMSLGGRDPVGRALGAPPSKSHSETDLSLR